MVHFTGLELTPKKGEYLKFLFEKGETVRTTDISSELQVDPSTATKTLIELASQGYICHIPYRGVSLSDKGKEYAKFLVLRHNILSLMLTHYGLSSEEACIEVSRFEFFVSMDAIEKIYASMGKPTLSVCGEISNIKNYGENNS